MSARETILRRLEGRSPDLAQQARALLHDPERPAIEGADRVAAFAARLAAPSVSASFEQIGSMEALPAAVARYIGGQAPAPSLYLPPDPALASLDWSGVARDAECPSDDGAALAIATAAVAETGSLVMDTGPAAPMLPNFLALHHLVVVHRETLVDYLEDVPPPVAWPRARYWITGVSGTTDIEGQYVRGAHGPRFLHVFLVG